MIFSKIKELTRLEQTLFGLPHLFSALLLSYPFSLSRTTFCVRVGLIFAAFFFARISGMAFNQYIDRHIDGRNPRTEKRVLPSGRLKEGMALGIAWASLILFLGCVLPLPGLCRVLAPVLGVMIAFYSFIKRLHASCHFVLGLLHFFAPVLCVTALRGTPSLASVFLGLVACFTISANDILYALQDLSFDKKEGLFSVPVIFGVERSFKIVRFLHGGVILFLGILGWSASLGPIYFGVLPISAWILWQFHARLRKNGEHIETFFFLSNVGIAFATLCFVSIGILWRAM